MSLGLGAPQLALSPPPCNCRLCRLVYCAWSASRATWMQYQYGRVCILLSTKKRGLHHRCAACRQHPSTCQTLGQSHLRSRRKWRMIPAADTSMLPHHPQVPQTACWHKQSATLTRSRSSRSTRRQARRWLPKAVTTRIQQLLQQTPHVSQRPLAHAPASVLTRMWQVLE